MGRRLNQQEIIKIVHIGVYLNLKEKGNIIGSIIQLYSYFEDHDPYLKGHSMRVSRLSERLAQHIKPELAIDDIVIGALLHDIGKLVISGKTLKSSQRYGFEQNPVKEHTKRGYELLKELNKSNKDKNGEILFNSTILNIVRYHHENVDGTGYPSGLKMDDIPIEARLVRITDSFDAMTHERPYRIKDGMPMIYSVEEELDWLKRKSRRFYDEELINIFINERVWDIKSYS